VVAGRCHPATTARGFTVVCLDRGFQWSATDRQTVVIEGK